MPVSVDDLLACPDSNGNAWVHIVYARGQSMEQAMHVHAVEIVSFICRARCRPSMCGEIILIWSRHLSFMQHQPRTGRVFYQLVHVLP